MTYDQNNLWSDAEDNAIRQFYPRHGTKWEGWAEVLPTRTKRAIGARATRLGVKVMRNHVGSRKRKKPTGDERHYNTVITREPDPYEGYVLDCMSKGMTPSEIDRSKHWWPSTTIRILREIWEREK